MLDVFERVAAILIAVVLMVIVPFRLYKMELERLKECKLLEYLEQYTDQIATTGQISYPVWEQYQKMLPEVRIEIEVTRIHYYAIEKEQKTSDVEDCIEKFGVLDWNTLYEFLKKNGEFYLWEEDLIRITFWEDKDNKNCFTSCFRTRYS